MKIVVCSDNHGLITPLEKIVENYQDADAFIHCGDVELDPKYVANFHTVNGNNDYFHQFPQELVVTVDDIKILVVHGHQFYGNPVEALATKALNLHCKIACYGHSHVFNVEEVKGVLCINPGSLRYNRDGTPPCFAVLERINGKFKVDRKEVSSL